MNISIIRYIISWIIFSEGFFFALPTAVGLIYGESEWKIYAIMMALCMVIGAIGIKLKTKSTQLFSKEGYVVVALGWIVLGVIGAVPFVLTGEIPHYINALFETISGFTTTGASILSDVEALSHASLFWRSFTHWIGGMGILVFLLSFVQISGGSNIHIMKAESPGPSVGKLVPRVKDTARILYVIYIVFTAAEILLLLISGMGLFEAVTMSIGTAGTGGFGILNSSAGSYTILQQGIIAVFMIMFGVNFNAYFLIIKGKVKQAFSIEEIKWYLLIIAGATLFIGINMRHAFDSLALALHHAFFTVASIITTTGFSTADFNTWSTVSQTVIVLLMFLGACAGSTGGGMKVSRFAIMAKVVKKEIAYLLHPRSVKKVCMDKRPIDHEVIRSVNTFLITYMAIFIVSLFIVSFDGKDLVTNFTSIAATLNNIGPGLSGVGPTSNFGDFSVVSKLVMMIDMLAGRLEIFPIVLLLSPSTWKKQ